MNNPNIHVIGYPFAGGQPKAGVELTPEWLQNQKWFKEMDNTCSFEMVEVTNKNCNSQQVNQNRDTDIIKGAKNWHNVLNSAQNLKTSVINSLRNATFPIVVGGDHS